MSHYCPWAGREKMPTFMGAHNFCLYFLSLYSFLVQRYLMLFIFLARQKTQTWAVMLHHYYSLEEKSNVTFWCGCWCMKYLNFSCIECIAIYLEEFQVSKNKWSFPLIFVLGMNLHEFLIFLNYWKTHHMLLFYIILLKMLVSLILFFSLF